MFELTSSRIIIKLIFVFVIAVLAGCAIYRDQNALKMEKLLAASGFKRRPADTERKLA